MAKITGKILVIDDDSDVLLSARLFLKQHFTLVQTEKNPFKIDKILGNESFDVVLLDMNYTAGKTNGVEGFNLLSRIFEINPHVPVILITAYGDIDLAVKAIKKGAMDFVVKPWQNEKLLATVIAALKYNESKQEVNRLKSREQILLKDIDSDFTEFIGVSAAMKKVFATIEKVAKTDANVLILGENGTGKELVARSIHRQSLRKNGPIVSVDLGAITESLFESELFGHVKGSFTDAKEDRAGRFEIAAGGSLFLDEIGNLSMALQSKLLTAIQGKKVSRVGSNKVIDTDIRLICATNMPLYEMVHQHKFRQDLLYRINTVEIQLPPLRERIEDIEPLAGHYLNLFSKKYNKPDLSLEHTAVKKLEKYSWPGNIRELQHAIERVVIMADDKRISSNDFLFGDNEAPLAETTSSHNLEELEVGAIKKVINKHSGNISQAAKELGLTRASLYRRLEKYGL